MSTPTPPEQPGAVGLARLTGASPLAAAAFAAGIGYAWLEALWRLLFTYYPTFNADWVLWNGRVGDIAAMWLTISGLAAVLGIGLYLIVRRRDRVGAIADWTVLLLGSAVAAPMIGEIGTPAGSIETGAGSSSASAVLAYIVLGAVVVICTAVLVMMHRGRSLEVHPATRERARST